MSFDPESFRDGSLGAAGHPIHTRLLEVELLQAESGKLRARAAIVDLRKTGFVPTGGELQTAGIIHQMGLDARIDQRTLVIEALEPSQAVVAFEANEATGGDSCRDPAPRLRGLVGERLDDVFLKTLSQCFAGPRGCSHLLSLAQLMASSVRRAAALEQALLREAGGVRSQGERIFKRSLVVDGLEQDEGAAMDVALQLADLHTAPRAGVRALFDRLALQHEVRVLAKVEMRTMTLASLRADERERDRESFASAAWRSRDPLVAPLVGQPALQGLGRELLRRFGGEPELRPLLDTLLCLAPGLIQCMAAMVHRMISGAGGRSEGSLAGSAAAAQMGGMPDSCYIWRSEGEMIRRRMALRAEQDRGGDES